MPFRPWTAAETALNPVVTVVFLIGWLLAWPFYLLYRARQGSH